MLRYVVTGDWINVEVSQAEIKQIDHLMRVVTDLITLFLSQALPEWLLVFRDGFKHEILRLDIPVDHPTIVDLFKA